MDDLNTLSLPALFERLTADGSLARLLALARCEDLGAGDLTTESIVEADRTAAAQLIARAPGVTAGLAAVGVVLEQFEAEASFEASTADGRACRAGEVLGRLDGRLRSILAVERTMLNLLGRLGGIATTTRRFVDAVAGRDAVICDTRKTTPGLRGVEKYAVRCGGGTLHRLGLHDAVLYKENHLVHLDAGRRSGALTEAIRRARRHDLRFVEIEVETLEELREALALEAGLVDIVLLDDMSLEEIRQAVELRRRKRPELRLEVSGGVSARNVAAIADTGVDRISVGALTHSAPALDIALEMRP